MESCLSMFLPFVLSSEGCLELEFSCFPQQSLGVKDQGEGGLPGGSGPTFWQCHLGIANCRSPPEDWWIPFSLPGNKFFCEMKIFQSDRRHTSRVEFSQPMPAHQVARALSLTLLSCNWFIWIHLQNGVKSVILNFVSTLKQRVDWNEC